MDKQTQKNLTNIVKQNYEEIADDFHETRKKYLWPELVKMADAVKDGDRVLDAGCGNGRLLEALKLKKIEYLGVDSSEKLIKIAKERFGAESDIGFKAAEQITDSQFPILSFKFQVCDLVDLGTISELNFNYVFCAAVLHHLPGFEAQVNALKQLKNKIGPDGKIIITVWNFWSQKKYRKKIFKFALLKLIGKNKMDFGDILFDWKNSRGERLSKRYYHAFRKRELRRIFKAAGLKIEEMRKDEHNYYIAAGK